MTARSELIVAAFLWLGAALPGSLVLGAQSTDSDHFAIKSRSKNAMVPGLSRDRSLRFQGFLLPDHRNFKLPVQIDFYLQSETVFGAVLKVNLGYSGSHEYLSQFYSAVTYDADQSLLLFQNSDWDLNLFTVRLQNGHIEGRFRSNSGQQQGQLMLDEIKSGGGEDSHQAFASPDREFDGTAIPTLPLISGQYDGTYDGEAISFQLELSKWFALSMPVQNPFYDSTLTGRAGVKDQSCGGPDKTCVHHSFFSGTFNPYSGILRLNGNPGDTVLYSQPPWLIYNGCYLKKSFDLDLSTSQHSLKSPPVNLQPKKIPSGRDAGGLDRPSGMYHGYLFHILTKRYQRMTISVESSPEYKHEYKRRFSPLAWLYFGPTENAGEPYLSFPFVDTVLGPEDSPHAWDSKADVIASISSWKDGEIRGQWISKTFGAAGPFVVAHPDFSEVPPVPQERLVSDSFGYYRSKAWKLHLTGRGDLMAFDLSRFFPLQLHGEASAPGVSEQKRVKQGVYDFYTGSLCFLLSDSRLVLGQVKGQNLGLFWPSKPRWGVQLAPLELQAFQRSSVLNMSPLSEKMEWAKSDWNQKGS